MFGPVYFSVLFKIYIKVNSRIWSGPVNSNFHFEDCETKWVWVFITIFNNISVIWWVFRFIGWKNSCIWRNHQPAISYLLYHIRLYLVHLIISKNKSHSFKSTQLHLTSVKEKHREYQLLCAPRWKFELSYVYWVLFVKHFCTGFFTCY